MLLSIVDPERKSKSVLLKAKQRILARELNLYLRYGLLMYLAPFMDASPRRILNRYLYDKSSILQSLILSNVSIHFTENRYIEFLNRCLIRTRPDAGLVAIHRLVFDQVLYKSLDLKRKRKHPSIRNSLIYLGLVKASKMLAYDPFQEIILNRYGVDIINWKPFLGKEFKHAHQILVLSDKIFESNKSQWLCSIDSFNDILIRSLITSDTSLAQKTVGRNNKRVTYGTLLDENGPFGKKYLLLANNFRTVHNRRCSIPETHAYDEKTSKRAKQLKNGERNNLYRKLKVAYKELAQVYHEMRMFSLSKIHNVLPIRMLRNFRIAKICIH